LLILALGISSSASAVTTVYHCTKDGQIVLTDKPCDVPSAAGAGTAPAIGTAPKEISATPTVVGEWKGQTQNYGTENGQLLADAHSVVVLTLSFTEDGKVSGSSPDNGCRVLGI
jgi:hypothetical protein